MTTWQEASTKLGDITPATREFARRVFDAASAAGHDVWFLWGIGPVPEHNSRCAIDFMVRTKAAGDWIRNHVWAYRDEYGLRHVIWWQRIVSTVTEPGRVRVMEDRGNDSANHFDHVHVLRFDVPLRGSSAPAPARDEDEDMALRTVLATVKGRSTVWVKAPDEPLRPLTHPWGIGILRAAGAVEYAEPAPDAATLVDTLCGPMPGLTRNELVSKVAAYG